MQQKLKRKLLLLVTELVATKRDIKEQLTKPVMERSIVLLSYWYRRVNILNKQIGELCNGTMD